MGVFFERRGPDPRLVDAFRTAFTADPQSDAPQQRAAALASAITPLVQPLAAAVSSAPPRDPEAAAITAATAAGNTLLGGAKFNTGRFVVATIIFAALLGGAITTDATNLTSSSTALYALATTVFGVVIGFLGGESS
ncbi:MAG TPA: hypothetical protein VGG41_05815 [Solirubrobacteraceae bacterium]